MADAPAAGELRIVVVDDELYNRDLMIRTFARTGEVVAAADAAQALEVLGRWTPDVLVTDFLLGGPMNGVELARQVRATWPAMRIVVVTGFENDPALIEAQAAGVVDAVIPKPWAPSALRMQVLNLVRR